jgi:hypothetical protein
MSENEKPKQDKLQSILDHWGKMAVGFVIALGVYSYQGDRQAIQNDMAGLSARTGAAERSIGRLQDQKASREEVKELQTQFLREMSGTRMDFKEGMQQVKLDIIQRLDMINKR